MNYMIPIITTQLSTLNRNMEKLQCLVTNFYEEQKNERNTTSLQNDY